jgi:methyltransferase (TIGR00027 family)
MVAARTRFFDGVVESAIAGGTPQIVIVGAGYDDRALRFRTPGVRFYEVDHPATQADKARRLTALPGAPPGPSLVAADLDHDDPGAALAAAGHDAGRCTLFLCEGVLVYLDLATVEQVLTALHRVAHPAATLAASLAVHAEGVDSARVVAAANARRLTGEREPWQTILPAGEHRELLARCGWRVATATDVADLGDGVQPGRTLLVTGTPA